MTPHPPDPENPFVPYRRDVDRVMYTSILNDVARLKTDMEANTKITAANAVTTEEIRNILITFRTIVSVAKGLAAVLTALGALWLAFKVGVHLVDNK